MDMDKDGDKGEGRAEWVNGTVLAGLLDMWV